MSTGELNSAAFTFLDLANLAEAIDAVPFDGVASMGIDAFVNVGDGGAITVNTEGNLSAESLNSFATIDSKVDNMKYKKE